MKHLLVIFLRQSGITVVVVSGLMSFAREHLVSRSQSAIDRSSMLL